MAKPSRTTKAEKSERRALVEKMRKEQQRQERRRTLVVVVTAAVVAIAIIGVAAYPAVRDSLEQAKYSGKALSSIGLSPSAAGCQDVTTKAADGNQDHRTEGSAIPYADAPPAFGPHYPVTAPIGRKFYTAADRPALPYLVHNLEHGYTILWYDDSVSENNAEMAQLKAIGENFAGTKMTDKFIVAPYTSEDGSGFPDGTHVATSHWMVDANDPQKQTGVWQYCSKVSGEAVDAFVKDYPYSDSPEPGAM